MPVLTDVGAVFIIRYTLLQGRELQEKLAHRINSSGVGTLVMKDNEHVNTLSHTSHYHDKVLDVICSFRAATKHTHAWKI